MENQIKGRATDIDLIVAKNLKRKRIIMELSQNDLATAVGLSIQQIQKYEKCQNRITSGKLYVFSKLLNIPITDFFKPESEEYKEIFEKSNLAEKEILNFIKVFTSFNNEKNREKLIQLNKLIHLIAVSGEKLV